MKLWKLLRLNHHRDQISPWWGIALALAGSIAILFGLFWEGTWEDVSIEVGAAALVGGIVLYFKPRLMRQVDERAEKAGAAIAEAIASSAKEEWEERLVRLESIKDIQANVQEGLQAEVEQALADVADNLCYSSIDSLLMVAHEHGLFYETVLFKTSEALKDPLIEVVSGSIPDEEKYSISLRIWTLQQFDGGTTEYYPADYSEIEWEEGEDVRVIVRRTILTFKQLGIASDDPQLSVFFDHLTDSCSLMSDARQEPQGSSNRIESKLIFLINEEWAITDRGMEGTRSPHTFLWNRDWGPDVRITFGGDESCPEGCSEHLWEEARHYAHHFTDLV